MASITTVTVDENPAPVDETRHKVSISKPDGSVETLYQCEVCNKTFSTAASLTSHRWQHTKPFQCEHDKCKARFASKGNLVIHRRRHTGDRPYDCNLCDAKFRIYNIFYFINDKILSPTKSPSSFSLSQQQIEQTADKFFAISLLLRWISNELKPNFFYSTQYKCPLLM